jgi:uncharacterized protein DUF4833
MFNDRQYHKIRQFWRVICAFALIVFATDPALAAKATSISITATAQTKFERPDFPLPKDPLQLFFLQRSMNANTIVYAVRLDESGKINPRSPIDVYWRRFQGGGERKELGMLERNLAFGVNTRKGENPGEYLIEFKALKGRFMTLSLNEAGSPRLTGMMGDRMVKPQYIFVDLAEGGLIPKVKYLYLHGLDLETGQALKEILKVSGGEISN